MLSFGGLEGVVIVEDGRKFSPCLAATMGLAKAEPNFSWY
jgi:hypothetical protein